MKLTILNVGRVRQKFVLDGEAEYLKRLRNTPYSLDLVELGLEAPESMSASEIQRREANELLKRLPTYDWVIVLDERGKQHPSEGFSMHLEDLANRGIRSLVFVIGGAFGFDEKIRGQANEVISLSKMTMPHQLIRLVLVEQIYRAYTLARGLPYHK